tara:strand:+ start:3109 stop:3597 length:489 start_codon:yes stop_codon:yes gene_type:complete
MASNLEFIKFGTADDVSSFTITDIFSDKYDVYEVFVIGNGSANVGSLSMEFLDSGGTDIAQGAYDNAMQRMKIGSAFDEIRGTNLNSTEWVYPGGSDRDFAAKIIVYNPFSSSTYTFATHQSMSQHGEKGIAVAKSTTSAVSLKFRANQNFTPIKVSVYGVK